MKAFSVALLVALHMPQALPAQQFTPPALPPGVTGAGEKAEGEILKVYSMEDQGATFRAYVVKYKGTEVIVGDNLATTSKKVGEKITFVVSRVELPLGARKIHSMSFQILNLPTPKKP